jgi:hypothetical protein
VTYESFRYAFVNRFTDKHRISIITPGCKMQCKIRMRVPKRFWIVFENGVNGRSKVVITRYSRQSGVGHNTRGRGVDGTRSHRTDSRTSAGHTQLLTAEGGVASGPMNGHDRYTSRPQGIQCFNCGLVRHTPGGTDNVGQYGVTPRPPPPVIRVNRQS